MGVGFDFGVAWERPLDTRGAHVLGLGINLQNLLEPSLKLDEETVNDPRNFKLGFAYTGNPSDTPLHWTIASDLDLPSTSATRWGMGVEVGYKNILALRGGVDSGTPTLGFGIGTHGIRFEYALWSNSELARSDRFTLAVRFGTSVDQRRADRQAQREAEVREELETMLQKREHQAQAEARSQADAAFAAGQYEDAARFYETVLLWDPEDQQAQERIDESQRLLQLANAKTELDKGESARAAAIYQAVLERWPQDQKAASGLELARGRLRRSEDRERQLNSLFRDALTRFSEGDFMATRAALDELLRLDPDHELGRELWVRTESLRVSAGEEQLAAARSLAESGRFEAAYQRLNKARRYMPEQEREIAALERQWRNNQAALIAEQLERSKLAKSADAPASSAAAVPLTPQRESELQKMFADGLRSFQAGDFDGATRQWQKIWDEAPGFESVGSYLVKAYLLQGIHLYSQGDYRMAMSRCNRVLEIDPANEKARRYLARIQEEQQATEAIRGD